jgi:hypothetical protein
LEIYSGDIPASYQDEEDEDNENSDWPTHFLW